MKKHEWIIYGVVILVLAGAVSVVQNHVADKVISHARKGKRVF